LRLSDYFRGKRLTLATRLPPAEVERRIKDAAESIFYPFATGAVGWARYSVARLRYRRFFWLSYSAKPVLAGRIRAQGSGSRLDLNYRAPLLMYLFMAGRH
jgi:hypothetical protein